MELVKEGQDQEKNIPTAEEQQKQLEAERKQTKIYRENLSEGLKTIRLEEEYNRLMLSSLQCKLEYGKIQYELEMARQEAEKAKAELEKGVAKK